MTIKKARAQASQPIEIVQITAVRSGKTDWRPILEYNGLAYLYANGDMKLLKECNHEIVNAAIEEYNANHSDPKRQIKYIFYKVGDCLVQTGDSEEI